MTWLRNSSRFYARHWQLACRRQRRNRPGAAAVEFAIAAPILFLMVFGIVEFGRVIMVRNALTNAAREGCRRAVLATTLDRNEIDAVVNRYVDGVAAQADVRVNIVPNDFANVPSETLVTVNLSVTYSDVSWLPIGILFPDFDLRTTATQRRE